jgi:hypothetical protein
MSDENVNNGIKGGILGKAGHRVIFIGEENQTPKLTDKEKRREMEKVGRMVTIKPSGETVIDEKD